MKPTQITLRNEKEVDTMPNTPLTDVRVKLTREDGNAYNILGIVRRALVHAGQHDLAKQFLEEATSGDYDHVIATSMRYVHVD